MFRLTNEQRKCFGILPILDSWELIKLKPSKYDKFSSYAYKDGNVIKRVIYVSEDFRCDNQELYIEYQLNEQLSEDGTMLLPKTAKGKPVKLTASTLGKRKGVGMVFSYSYGKISVYNANTDQNYYQSIYEDLKIPNLEALAIWVQEWCTSTGKKELEDVTSFSLRERCHYKYKEGDYFKARINRDTYVYGKILLNYDRLRKDKIPFWDALFGKPLLIGIYRMATSRDDLKVEELHDLEMLPTHLIMDNAFYYGEYEIIGNEDVILEKEDLPIHYGKGINYRENCICFQRGTTFIKIDNEKALYNGFDNRAIGWTLEVNMPVLEKCIKEKSNDAYWKDYKKYGNDLRNPAFKKEKDEVVAQMTKYIPEDLLLDMKTNKSLVAPKTDEETVNNDWGEILDDGANHSRKINDLDLNIGALCAFKHMAVFIRWSAEHDLISDELIKEIPNILDIIKDIDGDIRKTLIINEHFDGKLRIGHFNKKGQAFAKKFYHFYENGFAHCVDKYAEKVLGSEKYNSDEYKNEAYLFVPYDEAYYEGLSEYINDAYEKFCKKYDNRRKMISLFAVCNPNISNDSWRKWNDYCTCIEKLMGVDFTHVGFSTESYNPTGIRTKKRSIKKINKSIEDKENIKCISFYALPDDFQTAAFDYKVYMSLSKYDDLKEAYCEITVDANISGEFNYMECIKTLKAFLEMEKVEVNIIPDIEVFNYNYNYVSNENDYKYEYWFVEELYKECQR